MPLHPEARSLLDLMAQMGQPALDEQDPVEAREFRRQFVAPVMEPCHAVADVDAGGVPARLYRPTPEPSDPSPGLLVWFHGGGWVLGDLDSHDNVCHALAARSGHGVLSVGYRLAPEDPFPAGLNDCIAATRWAHARADDLGVDPGRIAVGGDSAGGNLAAVVAHAAPAPLVGQVLVYPVTDARMGHPSYEENADGYFLTASSMRWFLDHYLSGGEGSPEDPLVSPLLASGDAIAASPPAIVVTAGFDPLRDEGVEYAERLAGAGVPTSHVHHPGQIHGFMSLPHLLADGDAALAGVAVWLRRRLSRPAPAPAG